MKQTILFLILCLALASYAQKFNPNEHYNPKMNISGSYYCGVIFKHSSKFIPEITERSHGFELAFSRVTKGDKDWQKKMNYPEMGAALLVIRFGDHAIFGNGFALIPYGKLWLVRRRHVDFYARIGFGLGYVTKPYDRVGNPTNNIIGSKLNNCTQFSFGLDYKVNRELTLFTALNFTHFSNAAFQSPNLGINYVAVSTGVRYLPKATKGDYNQEPVAKPIQKNFFRFNYSMAFYENKAPGGPKYPIYVLSGAYSRATSINNRFFTGVNYAFDVGKKEILDQFVYEGKPIKASDFSVFVGNELYMGRVSFDALIGVYLLKAHDSKAPVFAKLGFNYHAVKFGPTKEKSLFFGVHMKTHYSVAQYFDVGVGVNL